MSDFCSGCGTEHHWLACPEVGQSVFAGEDPEWVGAELEDLEADMATTQDPELRRMMAARHAQLVAPR